MSPRRASSEEKNNRYNVRVLDRAINILLTLADGKPRTLQEVSDAISLSPSTTFRLLATLSCYKFVQKDALGRYSLGLTCLELARAYYESNDLRKVALPELEALRDEVKETVHLAILEGTEVVYLEKLPGLHAIGLMGSRVGGRAPAYCTGLGKVLLAHLKAEEIEDFLRKQPLAPFTEKTITNPETLKCELEQIRKMGYALDRGEHEAEVRCVAVPIFDMHGAVVAAISISGPAGRMEPLDANLGLIERACQAARAISEKLGFRPRA
ncbi:MAG: IclR family transcriptional regulator [Thermanaerothrix sp.]|uniref:IclR family transcriptional regulator n=1 Tax=Thermanaerothrix sp. TaxID=2972675 RepID=UPI003C7D72A0